MVYDPFDPLKHMYDVDDGKLYPCCVALNAMLTRMLSKNPLSSHWQIGTTLLPGSLPSRKLAVAFQHTTADLIVVGQ